MSLLFAVCERTGKTIPLAQGILGASEVTGVWYFACQDIKPPNGEYHTSLEKLTRSPADFVDWMAHLKSKTWFDADKFMDFFIRLRGASSRCTARVIEAQSPNA